MSDSVFDARRAFGVFFVGVAVSVFAGVVLSKLAFLSNAPFYYYAGIWFGSFGVTFTVILSRFKKTIPTIRKRMRNSVHWSQKAKILNAVCWTGPFASIIVFPEIYQYLILAGIGLGNLATYAMMKKFSSLNNYEQLIVASISLAALPLLFGLDVSILANQQDISIMFSRIFIALSYGAGGAYALLIRN